MEDRNMQTALSYVLVAVAALLAGFFLYPVVRRRKLIRADQTPFCTHGPTKDPFEVMVLGHSLPLPESPYCPACTEQYLNQYSTHCALCPEPILPGTPVEVAGNNATSTAEFVHVRCGNCAAGFCGMWGEGKLIPPKGWPEPVTA
jgi:hypothetical protein